MTDDDLGAALGALFSRVDAVPQQAREAALAAIDWRLADEQIAALLADAPAAATGELVRGGVPRLLTFGIGDRIIEIEASAGESGLRLLGQLEPAAAADVVVESASGSSTARADGRGRFTVTHPRADRLRVRVTFDEPPGTTIVTEWFRP